MKKGLTRTFIEKKTFVIILMCVAIICGTFCYITIPKQHFPEVVLPVAAVSVVYPGASSEDLEELVTKKVEEKVMEVDGFDSCTSQTLNGVSISTVSLNMNLSEDEVEKSFTDLRRKIDDLTPQLPTGVARVSVNTDLLNTAGYLLAITGEGVSGDELSQRADALKDQLKLLDGVSKVEAYGKRESQVTVEVDNQKLNQLNISLAQIGALISAQNSSIPVGDINVDGTDITVNSSGKFKDVEEIKNIIVGVTNTSGTIIHLSDIADIRVEPPADASKYLYNDKDSVVLAMYFDSGLNVVSLGDEVREQVEAYKQTLPDNITVNEIYSQPEGVKDSVNDFIKNLIEAIIIVIAVVMLGMSLRNGLIVSVAIPLAVFISFIVMKIAGIEIQFISLAALIIVLGMLVDNAIVVSDSIQVKLDQGMERMDACTQGSKEVALPVFTSMLTTVAAFACMLTLQGAYRQLSSSLPIVIISALIASYIISMVVTPLMSYLFLKPTVVKKISGFDKLLAKYEQFSHWTFEHKKKTIIGFICFALLCSVSLFAIDLQITPKVNNDIITIEVKGYDEIDINKTEKLVKQIQKIVGEQPETEYYLSGIGGGIPRYDFSIMPKAQLDNVGDIFVRIDVSKGTRFKTTADMKEFLYQEISKEITDGEVIVDELGVMALTTKPVEVKIYSENLEHLNQAQALITEEMGKIEGTRSISSSNQIATYNYYIDMDTNKLNSLGLSKAEAQNEVSIALMGRQFSTYRKDGKEYPVMVQSDINDMATLENFKVKSSATNAKYGITQFASVDLNSELSSISRLDGQRGLAVGCYTSAGYSNFSIQTELESKLDNLNLPEDVRVELSGEKKGFMEVLGSITGAGGISIAVIMLILILQFTSIKQSLLVFISIPFAALTGIAALTLTNQKLSFFALLGILSMIGTVLANAIVLLEFINEERRKGYSTQEACKAAGVKRFRPIVISTMTNMFGLLPLILHQDVIFMPMALLLMIGLFIAMIVNLILVPIIYEMMEVHTTTRKVSAKKGEYNL